MQVELILLVGQRSRDLAAGDLEQVVDLERPDPHERVQCTWGPHLKPDKSIDWFCSYVTQLKDGPYTDLGQLTGVGVKRPNGDVLMSITGGTGAYENASGYAFQTGDTGRVLFSIHLAG